MLHASRFRQRYQSGGAIVLSQAAVDTIRSTEVSAQYSGLKDRFDKTGVPWPLPGEPTYALTADDTKELHVLEAAIGVASVSPEQHEANAVTRGGGKPSSSPGRRIFPHDLRRRPPTRKDRPPTAIPPDVLKSETIVASCGLQNFEEGGYSLQKTKVISDYVGKDDVTGLLTRDPALMQRLKEKIELNHPDLVRGRNVVVIDVSQFVNDPGQKKNLRDHKGTYCYVGQHGPFFATM